jgi:hypothetical protein
MEALPAEGRKVAWLYDLTSALGGAGAGVSIGASASAGAGAGSGAAQASQRDGGFTYHGMGVRNVLCGIK